MKKRPAAPRREETPPAPRTATLGVVAGASALFLLLPAWEVLASLSARYYYVNHALFVHRQAMTAVRLVCWALAAAVVLVPGFRRVLAGALDARDVPGPLGRRTLPLAACAAFTAVIVFLKHCQYRGFQLPIDSTAMTQMAWNTVHGRWLDVGVFGVNALGIHFAFFTAFLGPLLLVWPSTETMVVAQALALGSLGWAAYELTYDLTESNLAAFLSVLVCYTHPFFYNMAGAAFDNSLFEAPLFLWAAVAWRKGRPGAAALLAALALTTREQFPFTLAGLAVWYAVKDGLPTAKRAAAGTAGVLGSALLWMLLMVVVRSFDAKVGAAYWGCYAYLGSTPVEIVRNVLLHPFGTLGHALFPLSRLASTGRALLYASLLPLAAPLEAIPWLVSGVPLLLMLEGIMHDFTAHYAAMVFGPLMFAAVHGLRNLWKRFPDPAIRSWALAPVLLVAGLGVWHSNSVLIPDWRVDWFFPAPGVVETVPPGASAWADEFLTPRLATRAQLKALQLGPSIFFDERLFRPEYVLLTKVWLATAAPAIRDPILTFLARERYVRVLERAVPGTPLTDPANAMTKLQERSDIVVLRDPQAPRPAGQSPRLELPAAEPAVFIPYGQALLDGRPLP